MSFFDMRLKKVMQLKWWINGGKTTIKDFVFNLLSKNIRNLSKAIEISINTVEIK